MRTRNLALAVITAILFTGTLGMAGSAFGALLGDPLSAPVISFNNGGFTAYDAASGVFTVDAFPIAIQFPDSSVALIAPPEAVSIAIVLNGDGTLADGVPGDDLIVRGTLASPDAELLLTGEVTAFGFLDSLTQVDQYDFRFTPTGGSLFSFYDGGTIGVQVMSHPIAGVPPFEGDFRQDFGGEAKGPLGLIPGACEIEIDKTCCVPSPPSPGIDQCEGKVLRMVLEYTGDDCTTTANTQEGKAKCSGDTQATSPVDVVITGKNADKIAVDGVIGGTGGFVLGDTFTITNEENAPLPKELKASTKLRLEGPGGNQDLTIHTSCSKALSCGDQFGGVKVIELETTLGGVIDCSIPETDVPGTQCVPDQGQLGVKCTERPVQIVFEYTGEDCQASLPQPSDKASCAGDPGGAEPVSMTYTGKDPGKFTLDPASDIDVGETFSFTATGRDELHSESKFLIQDALGVVQSLKLHTSCSQRLVCGDEFGALKVVAFTQKDGTLVSCDTDPDPGPLFQDACEVPLAPRSPHCTSKVMELQLAYIGDEHGLGCAVTNPQDGKASCTGVDDPGSPVSVTITKDPEKVFADPDSGIYAPTPTTVDVISIFKEEGGVPKELGASTEFTVTGPGGSQDIMMHTSCSQPLNLGDVFGSFVVVGMERKDEGFVGLGGEVEYQYTVTSLSPPNTADVVNVEVFDDVYGVIVSGETLAPGESKTFFTTRTLTETTTNVATATGDLVTDGFCEAMDEVTVEIIPPPPPPFNCRDAKPIDELSMTWAGAQDVCVVAWDGAVGGSFLDQQDNVTLDDVVTVSGMGGSPNDQEWQVFAAGDCGGTPLGTSRFHISCSDSNMNGLEDCGKPQGNGKDKASTKDIPDLLDLWAFEGMAGDLTLDCTP